MELVFDLYNPCSATVDESRVLTLRLTCINRASVVQIRTANARKTHG